MEKYYKYFTQLLLFEILVLLLGKYIIPLFLQGVSFTDVTISSVFFTVNSSAVLLIFFRGRAKDAESQTMHSLVAISVKFLTELFFALAWIFLLKKRESGTLLLFFILYLAFTFFSVLVILKVLKDKSL
jgi:hypothetical protein